MQASRVRSPRPNRGRRKQVPAEDHPPLLRPLIEAVIFASPEPVTVNRLGRVLRQTDEAVQRAIDDIIGEHDKPEHGVYIRKVAVGYQMATKPEHQGELRDILRGL